MYKRFKDKRKSLFLSFCLQSCTFSLWNAVWKVCLLIPCCLTCFIISLLMESSLLPFFVVCFFSVKHVINRPPSPISSCSHPIKMHSTVKTGCGTNEVTLFPKGKEMGMQTLKHSQLPALVSLFWQKSEKEQVLPIFSLDTAFYRKIESVNWDGS